MNPPIKWSTETSTWTLAMHRGAASNRSFAAWADLLARIPHHMGSGLTWYLDSANKEDPFEPFTRETTQARLAASSAAAAAKDDQLPADWSAGEIFVVAVDKSNVPVASLQSAILPQRPQPLNEPRVDVLWPQSVITVKFFEPDGSHAIEPKLTGWSAKLCSLLQPHWAYLKGHDHLEWSTPGLLNMSRGRSEFGLPQVGWLSYFADGQFPPLPVAIAGADIHKLAAGKLIAVKEHTWSTGSHPAAVGYTNVRRALLHAKVIRPPVAAQTDRAPYWDKHGLKIEALIPGDDEADDLLPSLCNEQDDEEIELSALTEQSAPTDAGEDGPQTSIIDPAMVSLAAGGVLPFATRPSASAPAPIAAVSEADPLHMADAGPTGTTTVGPNAIAAATFDQIGAPPPPPMDLSDYARMVACTEEGGPHSSTEARRTYHRHHDITGESHRIAVDAAFQHRFRAIPREQKRYFELLAVWRLRAHQAGH